MLRVNLQSGMRNVHVFNHMSVYSLLACLHSATYCYPPVMRTVAQWRSTCSRFPMLRSECICSLTEKNECTDTSIIQLSTKSISSIFIQLNVRFKYTYTEWFQIEAVNFSQERKVALVELLLWTDLVIWPSEKITRPTDGLAPSLLILSLLFRSLLCSRLVCFLWPYLFLLSLLHGGCFSWQSTKLHKTELVSCHVLFGQFLSYI